MNMRRSFDAELENLKNTLIQMGVMVTSAISDAMDALDRGDRELADQVITGDGTVDEMERAIEQTCLKLLLRQQPVAGDLRGISAALKMITDLERIGDAAADIAEISRYIDHTDFTELRPAVLAMADKARGMVVRAIDAYVGEDLDLAQATIDSDDAVDDDFLMLRGRIGEAMLAAPDRINTAIDYLMIIKYLERVGDHAVNICEWVEFYITGIHKNERIL